MSTLIERLYAVMQAMNWEHADLVRISGQSSSVVSQWLGNGSKIIKTIGKMEAAEALARESGFSAIWIAKGIGPQRIRTPGASPADTVMRLREQLKPLGPGRRKTIAEILSRLAENPSDDEIAQDLVLLMEPPAQQTLAASA